MKSSEDAELLNTENVVVDPERNTTVLLARVRPAKKLIALGPGRDAPAGKTTRSPCAPTFVTVRFAEIATAPLGMPHTPVTLKSRVANGAKAGPPKAPDPMRVSRTRHGVN